MATDEWEEVEVPRGAYISWGNQPGQHVTGRVIEYSETAGTTFNNDPCPQLSIELTEPAASINKEGARSDFPAGELIVLNCGQVSLKRAVKAASIEVGNLVKITLEQLVRTANGTVKEFGIKINRTKPAAPAQTQAAAANPFADTAPF